jgi:4-hydroxy-4-methyl-2-oxoglutarate aldolase
MTDYSKFRELSPTAYADGLAQLLHKVPGESQFMDIGIRPLWQPMPRIAGPAYTVRCAPGDNLMLHAAIYRAKPGSVIVVQADSNDFAVSGGTVCAIAQKHGIAGFIVDGVVRDLAEVRESQFPVFARGVIPIPGVKRTLGELQQPVSCGGVVVQAGDVVIADEEGIAVVPALEAEQVYEIAKARADQDTATSLEDWETSHRAKVERLLKESNFQEPAP